MLEIVIACLCLVVAAVVLLVPLPPTLPNESPMSPAGVKLFTSALYVGIAAVFVAVGIGSMRCKNSRLTMIVLGWFWLSFGLIAVASFYLISPLIRQESHMPADAERIVFAGTMTFMGVIFALMPAVFLTFYSLKSVKATCLAMAPEPADDSGLPGPLIAFAIWKAVGGLAVLAFRSRAAVVFGVVLRGFPAFLVAPVTAVASGLAAWLILRRRLAGWTLAVVKTVIWMVSALVTFTRYDMVQLAKETGLDDRVLQDMQQFPQFQTLSWIMMAASLAATVAFFVYTRKFFLRDR